MPPFISWKNRAVYVDESNLLAMQLEESTISADLAAASATLTVANIDGFAIKQYIIINPWKENAEIVTTHSSTAPTGSTITLAANTVYAHYTGEKIYRIEFNQVEISHSVTLAGTKTVLATSALQSDQPILKYLDTTYTSGFYHARFKDSVNTVYSGYSQGVEYGVWDKSTVGYIIDRAMSDMEVSFTEKLTLLDCYAWLNEGIQFIQGKLKRWSEHFSYNAIIGQITRGTNVVSMPTDAYDRETNKSLLHLRVGTNKDLVFLDPDLFDAQMEDVAVTQVTTEAVAGQTTLEIDNSYDFEESGTVNFYKSGTKYSVTYTGVTRSATAGILTGVPASGDGSISVTITVDTYIWQNEDEGIPQWFTVRNSNIEFYPLADGNEDNANLYADYAKVATSVDEDDDVIDFQRYDMLNSYLRFRIKMKTRNNGDMDLNDGHWAMFKEKLNDAIRTMVNQNVHRTRPNLNRMSKRGGMKADMQTLDISQQ
jgi:hypothetical protein